MQGGAKGLRGYKEGYRRILLAALQELVVHLFIKSDSVLRRLRAIKTKDRPRRYPNTFTELRMTNTGGARPLIKSSEVCGLIRDDYVQALLLTEII
ncbi:hypothetical protein NDU88_011167 [Pleurodeles waltl]|uniref:Uncharacterized protein n=1 Tax=Pleurodeles waltl TaxID=8319 RepID=A0AAV7R293_PLEWA|nr:hypothetical protein NDU88_011167 [Pleurodeles waltl]